MPTHIFPACGVAALLLLAGTSQAQNYRPFRPGLLYQLTSAAGDSTVGVRLEKANAYAAPDSGYYFNTRLALNSPSSTGSCGSMYRHFNGGTGPFGTGLSVRATGRATPDYAFGTGFLLKPGAPLNQSWMVQGSLTAQVTTRAVEPVLGQPDSVVTISFSDGNVMKLSKTWGFVSGPAVLDYQSGRRSIRQLNLAALPTKRLGQVRLGARAMYDFQPGDVFWFSVSQQSGNGPLPTPSTTYYGDSVLTRTPSRSGDTITYRIARGGRATQAWSVYTLVVSDQLLPRLLLPSNRYEPTSSTGTEGTWLTDMAVDASRFNGRPVQRLFGRYYHCATPVPNRLWVQPSMPDVEQYDHYAPGLGRTHAAVINSTCCYTFTSLIGYRKGGVPSSTNPTPAPEQWGTMMRFGSLLLSAADRRPAASTSAFPNPMTRELTVRFETQRPQTATLSLYNALGQLVQQRQQAVGAGPALVLLPLPALPAGLYTLHLRHDNRTEVLKLNAAGR